MGDPRGEEEAAPPVSALHGAVVDGLLTQTQVVEMGREEAVAVANRVLEALDRAGITAIDRARLAEWLAVVPERIEPLLRLPSRGTAVCDQRGYHDMAHVSLDGRWEWDVVVCADCEAATQVER